MAEVYRIHIAEQRALLAARKAPYYADEELEAGLRLGVRIQKKADVWVAKFRPSGGKEETTALGRVAGKKGEGKAGALDWAAAKEKAREWMKARMTGVPAPAAAGAYSLGQAVQAYLEDVKTDPKKGPKTAEDQGARLAQHLLGQEPMGKRKRAKPHPLCTRPLAQVTRVELKSWMRGLKGLGGRELSPGTIDRTISALIAALNWNMNNGFVDPVRRIEWELVLKKSGKNNDRDVYLDREERRRLIDACPEGEPLRNLVELVTYTGARFGEAQQLRVKHFDARLRTLVIAEGKTGRRKLKLGDEAYALCKRLVKDSLPERELLVGPSGGAWKKGEYVRPFRAAAKAARMPRGTILYTLRHSWITQAINGHVAEDGTKVPGISLVTAARISGTSIQMINKTYGHLETAEAEAVAALRYA